MRHIMMLIQTRVALLLLLTAVVLVVGLVRHLLEVEVVAG
jgi:hypothetical protein